MWIHRKVGFAQSRVEARHVVGDAPGNSSSEIGSLLVDLESLGLIVLRLFHLDGRLLLETRGQVQIVGLLFVAVDVHLFHGLVNALVETRPLLGRRVVHQVDFLGRLVRDVLTLARGVRGLRNQSIEGLFQFRVVPLVEDVRRPVEVATLRHLGDEDLRPLISGLLDLAFLTFNFELSGVDRAYAFLIDLGLTRQLCSPLGHLDPVGRPQLFGSRVTCPVGTLLVLGYHRPSENDVSWSALGGVVGPQIRGWVGYDADILGVVFLRVHDFLQFDGGRLLSTVIQILHFHRNRQRSFDIQQFLVLLNVSPVDDLGVAEGVDVVKRFRLAEGAGPFGSGLDTLVALSLLKKHGGVLLVRPDSFALLAFASFDYHVWILNLKGVAARVASLDLDPLFEDLRVVHGAVMHLAMVPIHRQLALGDSVPDGLVLFGALSRIISIIGQRRQQRLQLESFLDVLRPRQPRLGSDGHALRMQRRLFLGALECHGFCLLDELARRLNISVIRVDGLEVVHLVDISDMRILLKGPLARFGLHSARGIVVAVVRDFGARRADVWLEDLLFVNIVLGRAWSA